MAALGIGTIITGLVVIAACVAVLTVIKRVRTALAPIREIAKALEGHVDKETLNIDIDNGPKSVNSMTSIFLPTIERDFPEFNYYEFKTKAENMIKSAFNAITTEDITKLQNASPDLYDQIANRIQSNKANGFIENISEITIHRTEIKNYKKDAGSCIITLQSSVGYRFYKKNAQGEIVKGADNYITQTRYDTDLMYVQDITKFEKSEKMSSNNCPNCGAPITMLGVKACPYCGSGVTVINVRTWAINKLTEV